MLGDGTKLVWLQLHTSSATAYVLCFTHCSAMTARSSLCTMAPVGLWGEFTSTNFVHAEKALRICAWSILPPASSLHDRPAWSG